MGFFSDFKLVKNKRGYTVRYCDEPFIQVYSNSFVKLFKDYATQQFVNDISKLSTNEKRDGVSKDVASKLEKFYTIMKRDYFSNKNIRRVDKTSTDYTHFFKASMIVRTHGVSVKDFMNAQVAGLSFINDGDGVFPKPSQLSTGGAEDRLVVYMSEKSGDTKAPKRIELSRFDRETELKSNPKFMEKYEKIKSKTASLKDAYFVNDCMVVRKDYATPMVVDYVKNMEGKK